MATIMEYWMKKFGEKLAKQMAKLPEQKIAEDNFQTIVREENIIEFHEYKKMFEKTVRSEGCVPTNLVVLPASSASGTQEADIEESLFEGSVLANLDVLPASSASGTQEANIEESLLGEGSVPANLDVLPASSASGTQEADIEESLLGEGSVPANLDVLPASSASGTQETDIEESLLGEGPVPANLDVLPASSASGTQEADIEESLLGEGSVPANLDVLSASSASGTQETDIEKSLLGEGPVPANLDGLPASSASGTQNAAMDVPEECTVVVSNIRRKPAPQNHVLRDFFSSRGCDVKEVRLIMDYDKARGFGFVDFVDPGSTNLALTLSTQRAVGLAEKDGRLRIRRATMQRATTQTQ